MVVAAQSREYDVGRQVRGRMVDGMRKDGRMVHDGLVDGGPLLRRKELCKTCLRPNQPTETVVKIF